METKETGLKPQRGVSVMSEVSGNTGLPGGVDQKLRGGVYKHPQTGETIIALDDPTTGDTQARAYVRAGFEWLRDVEPGDVHYVGEPVSETHAKQPEHAVEDQLKELSELRSRLAALEAAESKRTTDEAAPKSETEQSQKHAQDAAEQQTEMRGTDNSGQVATNGGVNAPFSPFTDIEPKAGEGEASLNELRAKAKELGLSAGGTKEELKARIEDAEKEGK